MKKISSLFLISLFSGAITLGSYKYFFENNNFNKSIVTTAPSNHLIPINYEGKQISFEAAAEKTVNNVVHVKNVSYRKIYNPIEEYFFGYRGGQQQQQIGTGSGVIISEDGYIVTNNHVINGAQEIEITTNDQKTFKAKLVGQDSKMDIALLKIESNEKLPYAVFADSDQVKVGEWVLAVGNPYNLNSTVTAGIVSAKARNIGNNGIQSFIQTDAAVNPGNSGGALVNANGELIGINTMISSSTGSYVGYSFAVPSNITRKIIEDIMEFGNVQRAVLGVEGTELNGNLSKELNLETSQGFYVSKVTKNSGADNCGVKKGDVIVKLDQQNVRTFAELTNYIHSKRPQDVVNVTILRNGNTIILPVKLSKRETIVYELKGMEVEDLTASDKKNLSISEGVKIKSITSDNLKPYQEELLGSVIIGINGNKVSTISKLSELIEEKSENESLNIELITKNRQKVRIIL
ncbi:MAG: trypsin-like peptidase domain-containing protein [Flavobacterium sp.]